ncbi:MAG: superoxide dismutase [Candidatus Paceibacterota bacterium]|jgi:Fe-Mn family superoxide dismutase
MEKYTLPNLFYGYKDLEPAMSENQLTIHHQKHHQAYVNGCNALVEKMDKARKENTDVDFRAVSKEFSFQIGGHVLHSLFWNNLAPVGKGGEITGELKEKIIEDFGSIERLKKEFNAVTLSVEGSGWATLVFEKESQKLMVMQIEKHNVNIFPASEIIMVLDMFEHAYYIDYKNDKAKYVEEFWKIVNWEEIEKRFKI